jgi:hypothetical protein
MALEILTPRSPLWGLFIKAVYQAIVISEDPLEWRCEGDGSPRRHRAAFAVMQQMVGVDVIGTIESLRRNGLICDCAIAGAYLERTK